MAKQNHVHISLDIFHDIELGFDKFLQLIWIVATFAYNVDIFMLYIVILLLCLRSFHE